jgi:G3E family GTPase
MRLMDEKGQDLYRSKGILAVLGSDEKVVFQSVHMIMNMGFSSKLGMDVAPWGKDEKRINKLCFIGKNLNKEQMIADLQKCVFNGKAPEPGPVPKT